MLRKKLIVEYWCYDTLRGDVPRRSDFNKAIGYIVGKKLDFFCQELGREVNTIGAKNALPEVDAQLAVRLRWQLDAIEAKLQGYLH